MKPVWALRANAMELREQRIRRSPTMSGDWANASGRLKSNWTRRDVAKSGVKSVCVASMLTKIGWMMRYLRVKSESQTVEMKQTVNRLKIKDRTIESMQKIQ